MSRFAYLLERYPAFTQTFIVREVEEMRRQGVGAPVVSLRSAEENVQSSSNVIYAPESDALVAEIKRRRAAAELPKKINQRLEAWGKEPDKLRLYEAIWTGDLLQKRGIRHVHVHFAGLAARTACLMKELYGITYSFTGHAQDIFCKTEHTIDLGRLIREASAVITVADFSAKHLQHTYPAMVRKIHRVYNGLALPETPPERRPGSPPLILSVGRLIAKKGFADLIAACVILKTSGVPFQCQIVGDGPLEDELQAQISESSLSEMVTLTGPKSQSEISALLDQTQVFALAAVVLSDGDSDNLPTVITEAMAHGVPVVSTRVAGIPEQVDDGKTGFLVSPGDVAAFAEKLKILLTDNTLTQVFGPAAFARAQSEFSLTATVSQLRKFVVPTPWWKIC
ncbi:MAG: glycosyltransferase family 4 protein [Chthoniobacterales bacterium]